MLPQQRVPVAQRAPVARPPWARVRGAAQAQPRLEAARSEPTLRTVTQTAAQRVAQRVERTSVRSAARTAARISVQISVQRSLQRPAQTAAQSGVQTTLRGAAQMARTALPARSPEPALCQPLVAQFGSEAATESACAPWPARLLDWVPAQAAGSALAPWWGRWCTQPGRRSAPGSPPGPAGAAVAGWGCGVSKS
jgi:hypothetical protein